MVVNEGCATVVAERLLCSGEGGASIPLANTTSSQAPAEQLCSLPSWQDDPLAKNCGDSYNP
ncbi:hypothetical protein J2W86_003165 [Delftia lacustris]|nr:hypothetical protein [Delftia lacustris]